MKNALDLLSASFLASTWPYTNGHTRYAKEEKKGREGIVALR
jgi:hypothetical protein